MSAPRLLAVADVPQAMLLKEAAGWNQTEQDWLRALELEPEGCFAIDRHGRLAATATSICYGPELAWIGMVLTLPEFRGQGLARSLMERALQFLDGRGARCIKLDATSMGSPLYRKLGFVDECPIERWRRAPAPSSARELSSYEPDAARDFEAFGADRSRLLSRLATGEAASIPGRGYSMGRPGANAAYFGPCVAADAKTAERLLEWFLARHPGEPVYWDLLPENREAVQLARSFGFERTRELVRMARGEPGALRAGARQTYAIAGFEFG
jgi:GNAT superfamily N-acetyltransferase